MNEDDIAQSEEMTDSELAILIREKNSEKYDEIIKRYKGKLFAYLYRLVGSREEAEDLLQDVFLKAYKNLKSFDVTRKFSSWIYRIAHNEAVNFVKRKSLKRFIPWENVTAFKDQLKMSSVEAGVDIAWNKKEAGEEVGEAIARLPFKYKQILILRYYSDKSYEEIGEILDKPINTVGTLISRAKRKLAEELKDFEEHNFI
jgi:RNA polymerase sigma-70 factor, ECF subfamily